MTRIDQSVYSPYLEVVQSLVGEGRCFVLQDKDGLHLKFKNEGTPAVNIQDIEIRIGFYFSSGNHFEWIFSKEKREQNVSDAVSTLKEYVTHGGRLQRHYKGNDLVSTTLFVGESQETWVKKIKLFGKKRAEDIDIPAP